MNPDVAPADDVSAEWWEATREHRLVVQTCRACGHAQHPPRAVCTACSSLEALEFVAASGLGTVDSWTVVHRAPRPDVPTPYTIARVRLVEGPILLTVIDSPDEPALDDPVEVAWSDLPDGRALPVFRPTNPPREA